MNIKKAILVEIRKELNLKEKLISHIIKKYTFKIYKIGFDVGFNKYMMRGCNKAVTIKTKKHTTTGMNGLHNI